MELLEKLGINPLLLITQVINFLILLFILKKFLYKPVLDILEKRRAKVIESLKKAEEINKKYQESEKLEAKKISEARTRAQQILQETKEYTEKIEQEILSKAEKEAKKILEKAKEEIKNEKKKMLSEVKNEIAEVVIVTIEKVLKDQLDKSTQKRIIEKTLEGILRIYK